MRGREHDLRYQVRSEGNSESAIHMLFYIMTFVNQTILKGYYASHIQVSQVDDGRRDVVGLPILSLFIGKGDPPSSRQDRRVRSDSSWEELLVVTDAESATPLCTSTNLYHRG